jgi:hypothetical protein
VAIILLTADGSRFEAVGRDRETPGSSVNSVLQDAMSSGYGFIAAKDAAGRVVHVNVAHVLRIWVEPE